MIKSNLQLRSIFLFSIPFFLLFSIALFTQSSMFLKYSESISSYLIMDLLLTVPLIYFLVVRKTQIPNTTVIPMIFIGLFLGYYILPIEQHHYLDLFKQFGLPIIEISVFVFVLIKVHSAIRSFKANNKQGSDFYNVLQQTCSEIVPGKLSSFLASEISVIYYGFLNWKKPILKSNEFTYHKRSGSPALFGALIFIVLVETISVHILLVQWSHTAAIILSTLSIYTGLQLLGFSRSLAMRPIQIYHDSLILRYGILNESVININEIDSIELSRKPLKFDDEIRRFSILGDLESYNVVIRCKDPQKMNGIYGLTKSFSTLALHIDEKERFKAIIEDLIRNGLAKIDAENEDIQPKLDT